MGKFEFSALAREDIWSLWFYIAQDDPAAADGQVAKIYAVAESCARYPAMGRLRTKLGSQVRSFPLGRYLIFYRPQPDGILVIRILHAARDIDAEFPHD